MSHPNTAPSCTFDQVRLTFRRVYDLPPAERPAALERMCHGDADLQCQVESLLVAFDGAGEFLSERNGVATPLVPQPDDHGRPHVRRVFETGDVLSGKYALARPVGEGGMGEVWEADQIGPIRRRVAVKMIRPGLNTRAVLDRFEAERQVLALMDHPHIARVLDGGSTEWGQPYFVMELIAGEPITRYCDARRLPIPQRLELFTLVCDAVRHAHQRGVIHRDLKPGNVLVEERDGKPTPKVIDFGLAKLLVPVGRFGANADTGIGTVLGTPQYMAPEQVGGDPADVDTRADVYALGGILYELLTGTPPLTEEWATRAGLDDILRTIRHGDTPLPSARLSQMVVASVARDRHTDPQSLAAAVRGELDWIVMKALAKERHQRYGSVQELGQDVGRHLRGEPVTAAPPSTPYRVRKFVRRHRVGVTAGGLILVALGAAVTIATWGYVTAVRAGAAEAELAARERERKESAERGEAAANQAVQLAVTSLDALTSEIVGDSLLSQTAISPQQKKLLTEILPFYYQLSGRAGGIRPLTVARAARRIGRIEHRLGHTQEALAAYELAVREFTAANDPFSRDGQRGLAGTYGNLADLFMDLGRDADAKQAYLKAVATQRAVADTDPQSLDARRNLAGIHTNFAQWLQKVGRADEAEEEYRSALTILLQLMTVGADPVFRGDLALTLTSRGDLLATIGRSRNAEADYREAATIQYELCERFPRVASYRCDLAWTRNNIGILHRQSGRPSAARDELQRCLTLREQLVHEFPASPTYRHDLATGLLNLGAAASDLNEPANAEAAYRKAIGVLKQLTAEFPDMPEYRLSLSRAHEKLAVQWNASDRPEEAVQEYKHSIAIRERLAADHPEIPEYRRDLACGYSNLGIVAKQQGMRTSAPERCVVARTLYEKACSLRERLVEQFPTVVNYQVELGTSYYNLGLLTHDEGGVAASLVWYDKAVAELELVLVREPHAQAAGDCLRMSYDHRARAYDSLGRYPEATSDWNQALRLSPDDQKAMIRVRRAITRSRSGEVAEAISDVTTALAAPKPTRPLRFQSARVYVVASRQVPDKEEEYAARAVELLREIAQTVRDAEIIRRENDFAWLRERRDFQQMLIDVKASKSVECLPPPRTDR